MSELVPEPEVSSALTLDAYLSLPTAPETWLVEPLIPAGGLVNLYGPPKLGKSFLALDMVRSITNGDSQWLNFSIPTPGHVLYLQLDTPRSLWIDRFNKLKEAGVAFTNEKFHVADIGQTPYPFVINTAAAASWLRKECDRIKPVLVVVDTTREAHNGNENDSEHMQKVISSLVLASRPAACLLISHSRKMQLTAGEPSEASLMDDNRGSGYISGRVDTIIQLRGKENAPKAKMVYQGRAVAHGEVKLTRSETTMLWECPVDPYTEMARSIMDVPFPSLRARARALAEQSGEKESRCLSTLARLSKEITPVKDEA